MPKTRVTKVTAFKAGGQLYETKGKAKRAADSRKLAAFCEDRFSGGNYTPSMIAGVLEEHAGEITALLKAFV